MKINSNIGPNFEPQDLPETPAGGTPQPPLSSDQIEPFTPSAWDDIKSAFNWVGDEAQKGLDEIGEHVVAPLGEGLAYVATKIINFEDKVKGAVEDAVVDSAEAVGDAIGDAASAVADAVSDAFDW